MVLVQRNKSEIITQTMSSGEPASTTLLKDCLIKVRSQALSSISIARDNVLTVGPGISFLFVLEWKCMGSHFYRVVMDM